MFQLTTRGQKCGKIVVKSEQLLDNVQRAVYFNHQNRQKDRMPSIAKKRLLRKKQQKHLLSSFQKTKATQLSGSVFADRIEQVKKTKVVLKLINFLYCFLDGHGIYTSNLVSFKMKAPKTNLFLTSGAILQKSIGIANDRDITHIKNPIAIRNAITNKIVPNMRQTHATHSLNTFSLQPVVFFQQMVL